MGSGTQVPKTMPVPTGSPQAWAPPTAPPAGNAVPNQQVQQQPAPAQRPPQPKVQATVQRAQAPEVQFKAPPAAKAAQPQQVQWAHGRRAKGRGKGAPTIHWTAAHDPTNFSVPRFLQRLGDRDDDASVLLQDTRDGRIVSPFQGLFPLEIAENSNSSLNVLTERAMLMTPMNGFYFNLFTIQTLSIFKMFLVLSIDSSQSVPTAAWDRPTASAFDHPAFKPFCWPEMSNQHPSVTDVKIRVGAELMVHLQFTAYRSDNDMSVTLTWINPGVVQDITDQTDDWRIIVSTFQGFRVSAFSVEPGAVSYTHLTLPTIYSV